MGFMGIGDWREGVAKEKGKRNDEFRTRNVE
jgi:hypothetical protein